MRQQFKAEIPQERCSRGSPRHRRVSHTLPGRFLKPINDSSDRAMRLEATNPIRPSALRTVLDFVANRSEQTEPQRTQNATLIDELTEAFCKRASRPNYVEELLTRIEHDPGNLIEAIARRLGEMWCSDSCSFAMVSIAMTRLHTVGHRLAQLRSVTIPTINATGTVLLTAPPGEQHTFGLAITEQAFISTGWRTRVVYPDSHAHFIASLNECGDLATDIDVVCVSWSNETLGDAFGRMIQTIRDRCPAEGPLLMAGGHSTDRHKPMLNRLGISHAPRCGQVAVSIVESQLFESRSLDGALAITAAE